MQSVLIYHSIANSSVNCSCTQVLTKTNLDSLNDQPLPTTVAFSPDEQVLAAGSDDATIRIWDATTGALIEQLLWHQHPVYSIVFMPDGKRLVSSDISGKVKFWDLSKLLGASNGGKNEEDEYAQSGNSKASATEIEREEEQNNCSTMTCTIHGVSQVLLWLHVVQANTLFGTTAEPGCSR